jgi:hypothetical protein
MPPTNVIPAAWQVAQPLAMPLWFIKVPLNVIVDLWQVSHPWEVGT